MCMCVLVNQHSQLIMMFICCKVKLSSKQLHAYKVTVATSTAVDVSIAQFCSALININIKWLV